MEVGRRDSPHALPPTEDQADQGGQKRNGGVTLQGALKTQRDAGVGRALGSGAGGFPLAGLSLLRVGSTGSERPERDFETVTSWKQSHIFDWRPMIQHEQLLIAQLAGPLQVKPGSRAVLWEAEFLLGAGSCGPTVCQGCRAGSRDQNTLGMICATFSRNLCLGRQSISMTHSCTVWLE